MQQDKISNKRWVVRNADEEKAFALFKETGIHPLVCKVLTARGMDEPEKIKEFLEPSIDKMHDPFLLNDMEKAVSRIVKAIDSKEKIAIYGDYDVDGVTSTSVLLNFLWSVGADAFYYIPDRFLEGYGISMKGMECIISQGASLIITVDCGITAINEVNEIKDKIDIIITDHHECAESLPDALAVINPIRKDSIYPFKGLAGVGVVYKLVQALCKVYGVSGKENNYLDLVALGTVADVVPLIDENRVIVKYGLEKIQNTCNKGLSILLEKCGLGLKPVDTWNISFMLAPRVNAAGRMKCAKSAVELFILEDNEELKEIADELCEINKLRQDIELEIMEKALEDLKLKGIENSSILVVAGEKLHKGVIGIVASRLTDLYGKPSIVISVEDGIGKGSGRSVSGFSLIGALSHCSDLLEKFGGHDMAAGITIKEENIELFFKRMNKFAMDIFEGGPVSQLKIDAYIEKNEIEIGAVRSLQLLSPFGMGNPSPVFALKGLTVDSLKTVGQDKHLKLSLKDKEAYIDAIGFNMGDKINLIYPKDELDVAFTPDINTWNSMEKVVVNLKDIKISQNETDRQKFFYNLDISIDFNDMKDDNKSTELFKMLKDTSQVKPDLSDLVPQRHEFAAVYRFLAAFSGGIKSVDIFSFSRKLSKLLNLDLNCFKLKKILQIFDEIELIDLRIQGYEIEITVLEKPAVKKNIEDSSLFKKLHYFKAI
ncbi:MAG TPA: single-stranded-DNA-specific exonuclease RecJ [Clostridia bacterium]